jgi:DNA-binding LacI/PurR family transcriptional regulator
MKRQGLKINEKHVILEEDQEKLEKKIFKMLSLKSRPSALCCASDPIAMQAIRAARKAGLKIPEDISIIGYANINAAEYADPPLTSIEEPFLEMGKTVCREIIKEIESKEKQSFKKQIQKSLDVKLILRESTAPNK